MIELLLGLGLFDEICRDWIYCMYVCVGCMLVVKGVPIVWFCDCVVKNAVR